MYTHIVITVDAVVRSCKLYWMLSVVLICVLTFVSSVDSTDVVPSGEKMNARPAAAFFFPSH